MSSDLSNIALDRAAVAEAVKRMVITESRLSIGTAAIGEDEPLNGELLMVNSLGFLGILMRLEDDLDIVLPDDLFVGRSFTVVRDLIDTIMKATGGTP